MHSRLLPFYSHCMWRPQIQYIRHIDSSLLPLAAYEQSAKKQKKTKHISRVCMNIMSHRNLTTSQQANIYCKLYRPTHVKIDASHSPIKSLYGETHVSGSRRNRPIFTWSVRVYLYSAARSSAHSAHTHKIDLNLNVRGRHGESNTLVLYVI